MTKINEIEFFPWNKNFETGIEEIDDQHKVLVSLLNKLGNALTNDNTKKMEKIFDDLAEYAEYHFKCEKDIWEKYFDKDEILILNHKHVHDSFLPKVIEIKEKNKNSPIHKCLEEILMFLIKWLAFHIIDEDKRLALIIKYINSGCNLNEAINKTNDSINSSMKNLIENILTINNIISSKAIDLIREREARIKAEKKLNEMNKKLELLSITDQLTNLFNRRHFENIFNTKIRVCAREQKYLGIILFDIDYFKKLNDTYGHQEGDIALIKIAKCMGKVLKRASDSAFRIGGEEFCILITSNKKEEAFKLARLLKEEINNLKIKNKNSLVNNFLTISTGVVSVIPKIEDTLDSLMLIADEKLYQAKNNGRNCIVF